MNRAGEGRHLDEVRAGISGGSAADKSPHLLWGYAGQQERLDGCVVVAEAQHAQRHELLLSGRPVPPRWHPNC